MSFVESPAPPGTADFEPAAPARAEALRARLQLHRRGEPGRADVERLIAAVYRQRYGARLDRFMPVLVSHPAGEARAAAGYRSADEPLFLERYLTQPIEQALAAASGLRVERRHIVEVGQFASTRPGHGQRLMPVLARHLVEAGYRWAVITATAELRRLFARRGLSSLTLAAALPQRLGADASRWGSYYEHVPKVLAGDLLANLALLERRC
jgi:hypothetical protein